MSPLRYLLCSVLARTQHPELHSQLQINNLPCSGCLWGPACPHPQGVEQTSLSGNPPNAPFLASAAGWSPPHLQRALWAPVALAGRRAGRPPPWWCAVQHFSNRRRRRRRRPPGDRGRGAVETRGAALLSGGGGPEAVWTSGAGEPGSSSRRSAAVSREVRAPGGAGAFPRGAGAGLNLGPP